MERLLVEFAIRMGLIAGTTALMLSVLRVRSAAARHAAWVGVLLAMLSLPLWMSLGPVVTLPVLPADGGVAHTLTRTVPGGRVANAAGLGVAMSGDAARIRAYATSSKSIWIGVYLMGVSFLLLRLAIGTLRANRLNGAACVVPVTVGLLRPRIILPEGSSEWPREQLDAVLTHECEHVRRRDPLVRWLSLFNRAVFWFHPLAWWLERRLSALAEEACDAAVLAHGCDAAQYAEYLLDLARAVERAGRRVNAVAMAMPGSALPQRIRNLASGIRPQRISRARLAAAALACGIPSVLFAAGKLDRVPLLLPLPFPARAVPQPPVLTAQAPQALPAASPKLEFADATVKPADPTSGAIPFQMTSPRAGDPERIAYSDISMHQLLVMAYGAPTPDLLLGLSTAEENARYDIVATIPAGTTGEQLNAMLQNLLMERFHLQVHRETQDKPEYELVVAPGGFKMQETQLRGGFAIPAFNLNGGVHVFKAVSPFLIAQACRSYLHRTVVDKTGLGGKYDATLDLTGNADVFNALEQQLGLRLEPVTVTLSVLVVDHMENLQAGN